MKRISLSHTRRDGSPLTATENIRHLADFPNGWMSPRNIERCKVFDGDEVAARVLLCEIEKACGILIMEWEGCR